MAQKKEEWFMIIAASLFLVGAVFMLVNTFGGQEWALWVGIAFAICAILLYVIVEIARTRFNKKYSVRESEIVTKQQKAAAPAPAPAVKESENQKAAEPKKTAKQPSKKSTSTKKSASAKKSKK